MVRSYRPAHLRALLIGILAIDSQKSPSIAINGEMGPVGTGHHAQPKVPLRKTPPLILSRSQARIESDGYLTHPQSSFSDNGPDAMDLDGPHSVFAATDAQSDTNGGRDQSTVNGRDQETISEQQMRPLSPTTVNPYLDPRIRGRLELAMFLACSIAVTVGILVSSANLVAQLLATFALFFFFLAKVSLYFVQVAETRHAFSVEIKKLRDREDSGYALQQTSSDANTSSPRRETELGQMTQAVDSSHQSTSASSRFASA